MDFLTHDPSILEESREEKLARINASRKAHKLPLFRRLGIFNRGRGGEWEIETDIGILDIFHALKIAVYVVKEPLTGRITKHAVMHNLWPGHTVLVVVNGDMVVSLTTNRFSLQSMATEIVRAWYEVKNSTHRGEIGQGIIARKMPELLQVATFDTVLDMTEPLVENSGISDQTMTYHVAFMKSEIKDPKQLQKALRNRRLDKSCTVNVKSIDEMTEIMESHIKIPGKPRPQKTKKNFRDVFSLGAWLVFKNFFLAPYTEGELNK